MFGCDDSVNDRSKFCFLEFLRWSFLTDEPHFRPRKYCRASNYGIMSGTRLSSKLFVRCDISSMNFHGKLNIREMLSFPRTWQNDVQG